MNTLWGSMRPAEGLSSVRPALYARAEFTKTRGSPGPQVYGVAFCKVSYEEPLKLLGFADSKTLTHEQRKNLLQTICSCPDDLKWAVRVMSPHDISRHMLQKAAYNL
jgi:ribonuclease HII